MYSLQGVVLHRGVIDGGHYWSQVKDGPNWYTIDDEFAEGSKDISDVYELEGSEHAYILFYRSLTNWFKLYIINWNYPFYFIAPGFGPLKQNYFHLLENCLACTHFQNNFFLMILSSPFTILFQRFFLNISENFVLWRLLFIEPLQVIVLNYWPSTLLTLFFGLLLFSIENFITLNIIFQQVF